MQIESTIDDPARRMRYQWLQTPEDTGGELLQISVRADPGGGNPEHIHSILTESFRILAGTFAFQVDGKEVIATEGSTVFVPTDVPHSFHNVGEDEAHLIVDVRPPVQMREFLETVAGLARSGGQNTRGFPTRPSAVLELAVLIKDYHSTTYPANLPMPIQRLVFGPLARLAHARGCTQERLLTLARTER